MELGNYTVADFMDVEGVFRYTSPQIICENAISRGVPRPMVDWMMDLLSTRKITSNLGSNCGSGAASTGTPLLDWNLMADRLLWLLNGDCSHAQTFVDDFAAVTVSSDLNDAVNRMQCMLNKVTSWCVETGLKVNANISFHISYCLRSQGKGNRQRTQPTTSGSSSTGSLTRMNTWTRRSGSSMLSGYVRGLWGG